MPAVLAAVVRRRYDGTAPPLLARVPASFLALLGTCAPLAPKRDLAVLGAGEVVARAALLHFAAVTIALTICQARAISTVEVIRTVAL